MIKLLKLLLSAVAEGEWSSQIFLRGSSHCVVTDNIISSDYGADGYRIQEKVGATQSVSNNSILYNHVIFKDLLNGDPSVGNDNF